MATVLAVGCWSEPPEPEPPPPPPVPVEPHLTLADLGGPADGGAAWMVPDGPRKAANAFEARLLAQKCVLRRRVSRPAQFDLEAACAHERVTVSGIPDGESTRVTATVAPGPALPPELAGFPVPGGRLADTDAGPKKTEATWILPAGDTGAVLEPARAWLADAGWIPAENVPFAPEGDTIAVFVRGEGERLRVLLRTNATGIPDGVWVIEAELRQLGDVKTPVGTPLPR